MDVIVPLAVTLFRLVQPLKVLEGISVTEAGSSTLTREVQSEKRLPSVMFNPSGRVIDVRAAAPLKAAGLLILFRVEGRFISERESQPCVMEFAEISSTPSQKVTDWSLSIFWKLPPKFLIEPGMINSVRFGNL